MSEAMLGDLIRRTRESRGMSQEELAKRIGTSRAYVSQIETGGKRWPRKYIPALGNVLRISLTDMERAAGRDGRGRKVITVDEWSSFFRERLTDDDIAVLAKAARVIARLGRWPKGDEWTQMPSSVRDIATSHRAMTDWDYVMTGQMDRLDHDAVMRVVLSALRMADPEVYEEFRREFDDGDSEGSRRSVDQN